MLTDGTIARRIGRVNGRHYPCTHRRSGLVSFQGPVSDAVDLYDSGTGA